MLNESLRNELILESRGKQIKHLDLFSKNFSSKFVDQIILNLKSK